MRLKTQHVKLFQLMIKYIYWLGVCRMASETQDCPDRWNHVRKILERTGPFAHPEFEASPEVTTCIKVTLETADIR